MTEEQYKYTYQYELMGQPSEEDCYIKKDVFWPYGEVKVGQKTRGEFGFIEIIQVFDEPSVKYGKFIAKAITWEEANADLVKKKGNA